MFSINIAMVLVDGRNYVILGLNKVLLTDSLLYSFIYLCVLKREKEIDEFSKVDYPK